MFICETGKPNTFEFFQGSSPKIHFRIRKATFDYVRGVIVPGEFVDLSGVTSLLVRAAANGVVFISREAIINPDQTAHPGKAYIQIFAEDTEDFTETVTAELQFRLIPASGNEWQDSICNLRIKESLF